MTAAHTNKEIFVGAVHWASSLTFPWVSTLRTIPDKTWSHFAFPESVPFFDTRMRKIQITFLSAVLQHHNRRTRKKAKLHQDCWHFPFLSLPLAPTNYIQQLLKGTYTLVIKCSKDLSLTVQAASWAQIPSKDKYLWGWRKTIQEKQILTPFHLTAIPFVSRRSPPFKNRIAKELLFKTVAPPSLRARPIFRFCGFGFSPSDKLSCSLQKP